MKKQINIQISEEEKAKRIFLCKKWNMKYKELDAIAWSVIEVITDKMPKTCNQTYAISEDTLRKIEKLLTPK